MTRVQFRCGPLLGFAALLLGLASGLSAQQAADSCNLPGVAPALTGNGDNARLTALARGRIPANTFVQRSSQLLTAPCFQAALNQVGSLTYGFMPAAATTTWNSGYPLDRDNGALWAGRGLSAGFAPGVFLTQSRYEVVLRPLFAFQQNRSFATVPVDLPGFSQLSNPGHPGTIDWPQRFGSGAYGAWDPGQSYARARFGPVTVGAATENIWIGAAQRYPILMSNAAAGFPHLYVNAFDLKTRAGSFTLDAFWGRLSESDYFDDVGSNDGRLITGLAVAWEPRWTPGLSLGAARLYTAATQRGSFFELVGRPYALSGGDTRTIEDNDLFALFARYAMPSARAEVYVEWAHEAAFNGPGDVLREPDQSQGYVLGFQKLARAKRRDLRVYGELIHLEAAQPLRAGRGVITFYTHGGIRQGHTNRGQLLGAWIGPGSDAQVIGVDLIDTRARAGIFVERVRFDADAYYNQWAQYYGHNGHDGQLGGGLTGTARVAAFEAAVVVSYAKRFNRNFRLLDGSLPGVFDSEGNFGLDLQVIWLPGLQF